MMRSALRSRLTLTAAACVSVGCGPEDARTGSRLPEFGAFRTIDAPAAEGAAEPWLVAEPGGSLLMSWLEPSAEGHALRLSRRTEGAWSAPRTVASRSDLFVNWADFPSVIRLPDGSLVAHWLQRTGDAPYAYGVRLSRSRDEGASWSTPVTPHTDGTPTEHGFVSLLPGRAEGSARAVWLDGRNYARDDGGTPFMTLRHAEVLEDGSLTEEALLDPRTCDCCQTSIAALDDGRTVAAYRGRTENEIRDIRVVRSTAGGWTEPETVADDGWRISACPVNGPAIAARGDEVAVAWFSAANDLPRVSIAFSRDGGARFGPPIPVSDDREPGRPLGRVGLALMPGGAALVSWLQEREGSAALMLAAIDPEGTRTATVVEAVLDGGRETGFPQLALSGQDAVLAWTEPGEPARIRIVAIPLLD